MSTQLRLSRALADVRRLSLTDGLTGLANRRAMQERLERELSRADRHLVPMSVLMVDVDYFKAFNDLYGHACGDQALVKMAGCLRKSASRANDYCARWGGEEFVVLLPDTDTNGALAVAHHLHHTLEELAHPHEASPLGRLTASVGIAALMAPDARREESPQAVTVQDRVEELLARADKALYRAKAEGRARSEFESS